jgi:3-oxosteroid 1-dehydrogenase
MELGNQQFDAEYDVVVVGAGAGGMTAALTARGRGMSTVIVEKANVFGGSTALSGGGVWIPNAPSFRRIGQEDDPQRVLDYLVAIAGEDTPTPRLARYVHDGPKMMEFLESQSEWLNDAFLWSPGYSDYFPHKGGNPRGRGLWAKPIDRRLLGDDEKDFRATKRSRLESVPKGMWLTSVDLHNLNRIRWGAGWRPYLTLFKLAYRWVRSRVTGERITANGQALVIRFKLALREAGIPIWLSTPLTKLLTDAGGAVVGIEVQRDGRPFRIRARGGVIVATGGFENNPEMRPRYQPTVGAGWSRASPDNQGDGQRAGAEVGGALALMDDAWWMPVFNMPGGLAGGVAERQYPGQFIVNGAGERFVNESAPYTEFGHAQLAGHESGVSHIPAWMIFDTRAFKRNLIIGHFPGTPMPKNWLESGLVKMASTIEDLAKLIDVPPDTLRETQERFNGFARQGRDDDFHRGESPYDNYYGDPTHENPNLGVVEVPPFYAIQVLPGDLGTKGGLVADEEGRVLDEDGAVIGGLYAVGNASAAVMGHSYAGPGATIGSAMIFGYVAVNHIADTRAQWSDAAAAPAVTDTASAKPPSNGTASAERAASA